MHNKSTSASKTDAAQSATYHAGKTVYKTYKGIVKGAGRLLCIQPR